MATTSQDCALDHRLLVIEELLLQRKPEAARKELQTLTEADFSDDGNTIQLGLYLSLLADISFLDGEYAEALDRGLRAVRILAGSPLHRQYGRILHVLAKTYWAIGDLKTAEGKARDALATFRRTGETSGQVSVLNELAHIAFMRSDFQRATELLDEAVVLSEGYPAKAAMLSGNAGRVRTLLGEWLRAEKDITAALEYYQTNGDEASAASALLSLGYLHLRKREFVFADNHFEKAREIIERLGLKRQRVIHRKYAGELALEKGDLHRARVSLAEAYREAQELAPESALVTQAGRRLAEVELTLDNVDSALKYAHKTLNLAVQIGETAEIGQARRVIGAALATRAQYEEAIHHGREALDIARGVGDPLDIARTALALAELMVLSDSKEADQIAALYEESMRLFRRLNIDFWLADVSFKAGIYSCRQGKLSRGFKLLGRAEKIFAELSENARMRQVGQFLASLADQAVALSISDENEFKLFGRLINHAELDDVDSVQLDSMVDALRQRTDARMVMIVPSDFDSVGVTTCGQLSPQHLRSFLQGFRRLLGEEISIVKPTLLMDCRRDPYVADLFPDQPDLIASVMVVPFGIGDGSVSYIYLDRVSPDGRLNPFDQDALNFAVGFSDLVAFKTAELQRKRLLEDNRRLKAQLMENAAFPNIITANHAMLQILDQVRQVIDSSISITLQGPTGCGKDLLARAIHYNSTRRNHRFISVNCAALPETLLESELFGYHRGAFTGADRDKPGLFEEADGGTFFLDEVADMPLSVQAKILRVLEEKELVRLGENAPRKVDVRIVSATNKDLKVEMEERRFRQDLFYRLAGLTFRLPALTERREDIPLLVQHFLRGSGKQLSQETLKAIMAYDWPGNVRELDNEIKKLVLLAGSSDVIDVGLLSPRVTATRNPREASTAHGRAQADQIAFDRDYSLYDYLASFERDFIIRALRERHGVKKHAAAMLNIPESTLRLKIKEYKIDLDRLDVVN
jgi:transcriptional regulator with GAF, ATPase, and Fis domain